MYAEKQTASRQKKQVTQICDRHFKMRIIINQTVIHNQLLRPTTVISAFTDLKNICNL